MSLPILLDDETPLEMLSLLLMTLMPLKLTMVLTVWMKMKRLSMQPLP